MCLACDMEGLWFAVMEARAAGGETAPEPDEPVALPAHTEPQVATLLPPPERGRVGEGVAGRMHETGGIMWGESQDPHPNPPPEEGGGGAPAAPVRSNLEPLRSAPSRRFACEETSAE
jgi:hypothetical protein